MLINDLSETSPRRRRIIQQPLRTEPPIALIGAEGRVTSELEVLLKRGHPLITFPSLSHFLAEPPRRDAWAAIVMARASAWDVRLERYVARRRSIALFAQPEEGYGWPEDVTRVRELAEVDAWLERLKQPEPISVVKKTAPRAPRKSRAAAPETPSWLQQDARVWNALASTEQGAAAEPTPEATATVARPSTRPPPKQLELAALGSPRAPRQRHSEPVQKAAPRGTRRVAKDSGLKERRGPKPRSKPAVSVVPARVAPAVIAPQQISALTRSLLKELKPLPARDEIAFLLAAAEVGILRASELLQRLHVRATSL